eukprot:SAG11_NODE_3155_length_2644_cov_3.394106_2_plen_620_part_00
MCGCVGGAAQTVDIGNQLSSLDVPEGLKEIIGSMVVEMRGLKHENAKLQEELSWLKRDKKAFENKMRVVEAELRRELEDERKDKAALRIEVMELRKQTKKNLRHINARLDQCEADTFAQMVERRQTQDQTPACGREAVDSMLAVCCASRAAAGNGHRLQESVGCDSLPPTCSLPCSYQFISFFDNCHDQTLMLSAEQLADWTSFYAVCSEVEQSAAEMGALQPLNVRMFRIMISSDAAQSQAGIFGGQGQTEPIIGPLPQLPPAAPASSSDSGSTDVEQYHAQCTTANILNCVPECNATHHGFELLATIDGTDTKFSCNLANMLYSWVGAAALGGFLGRNVAAFVSAVISGAAGSYVLPLMDDANVGTNLVIQPGQNVIISADDGLAEAPRWGSGGFTVGEMGSLTLSHIQLVETTNILVTDGGSLLMANMIVPFHALITTLGRLTDDSTLRLATISVATHVTDVDSYLGELTGTVYPNGTTIPPTLLHRINQQRALFEVVSGPCTLAGAGSCVGRWPGGYLPNEDCEIVVAGYRYGGWRLGACPVFDISYDENDINSRDYLTLPDGTTRYDGNCPTGYTLEFGLTLTWHSDNSVQGSSLNGLPWTVNGAGGGWQICFA